MNDGKEVESSVSWLARVQKSQGNRLVGVVIALEISYYIARTYAISLDVYSLDGA